MNKRLVADIGGTNSRFALYDPENGQFRGLETFVNRDFEKFEDVVAQWLSQLQEPAPRDGCIAVAAAPSGDQVTMFNMNWSFSCKEIADRFGFSRFSWINDFSAIAYSLPFLQPEDRHELHTGEPGKFNRWAAVGPGTGLGGATIEQLQGALHAGASEPGHMGLCPGNALELEIFQWFLEQGQDIYAEMLVSGPGLLRLYEALCDLRGQKSGVNSPVEVSTAALAGDDECSVLALECFCALLGSNCGDFVLANGAYGGLYLAGGIIPCIIPFLAHSQFHQRFCAKGAMENHLRAVPVYVITNDQPGLIGAAHAPV